jgi:hypothetical protein
MRRTVSFVAIVGWVVVLGAGARAQETEEPVDERVDRARVAAEAGRFEEARDLLRESLDADPRASTAFNLALVLESTGELVAARALYDQLLASEFGALPEDRRARASERRTALSGEIATLRISVTGAPRADVEVDGQPRGEARASGGALRVEVDPGAHVIRGVCEDGNRATLEVAVGRGEVRSVGLSFELPDVRVPDAAAGGTPEAPTDRGTDDGGVSPWLWVGIGAAAVIAGAVVTIVLLAQPSASEPVLPEGFLGSAAALRF